MLRARLARTSSAPPRRIRSASSPPDQRPGVTHRDIYPGCLPTDGRLIPTTDDPLYPTVASNTRPLRLPYRLTGP